MSTLPDEAAYAAAMLEHGDHPVRVDMSVLQLTMLVSSLQLALRHPSYPEGMRPYVEEFLAGATQNLTRLSPVLGAVMEAGNDPTQDVGGQP